MKLQNWLKDYLKAKKTNKKHCVCMVELCKIISTTQYPYRNCHFMLKTDQFLKTMTLASVPDIVHDRDLVAI